MRKAKFIHAELRQGARPEEVLGRSALREETIAIDKKRDKASLDRLLFGVCAWRRAPDNRRRVVDILVFRITSDSGCRHKLDDA